MSFDHKFNFKFITSKCRFRNFVKSWGKLCPLRLLFSQILGIVYQLYLRTVLMCGMCLRRVCVQMHTTHNFIVKSIAPTFCWKIILLIHYYFRTKFISLQYFTLISYWFQYVNIKNITKYHARIFSLRLNFT